MSKQKPGPHHLQHWRIVITTGLLAIVAMLLYVHRAVLDTSLQASSHARPVWLLLATVLTLATFCISAAIYKVLALHRLHYMQTLNVEIASAFVNRLLPAGIGGIGLHGRYLYKRKHTTAEAAVVVSVNNVIGLFGHLLLLGGVAVFYPVVFRQFSAYYHVALGRQPVVGLVAIVIIVVVVPQLRNRLTAFIKKLASSVRKFRLQNIFVSLVFAVLLTTTYTSLLFSTARAVGISINLLQTFIVFSIGILASTVTPTPGGLIGAEAGLYAGFMAFGVKPGSAGGAVLLYRLLTYWLPLLPGYVALLIARKRKLV